MICRTNKEPERIVSKIRPPIIEAVNVQVKTQGKYKTKTGQPRGLVVHFTAGHSRKGREDAINTLNNLAFKGLGCLVMDDHGKIYRAQNQFLDDVAYHCGSSEWIKTKGISSYCMGMEICNAGKLSPKLALAGKVDKYSSWFGEEYYPDEVRYVHEMNMNQFPGYYHKFTKEQEDSLWQFCKWQKDINPEFDYDWVVGHDEIAVPLGRKNDPGGSLSCDMQDFRFSLKKLV